MLQKHFLVFGLFVCCVLCGGGGLSAKDKTGPDGPVVKLNVKSTATVMLQNGSDSTYGSCELCIYIPVGSGIDILGDEPEKLLKLLKVEDDTGKSLLTPDIKMYFSNTSFNWDGEVVSSKAIIVRKLGEVDPAATKVIVEADLSVVKKVVCKKKTFKLLAAEDKIEIPYEGGKATITHDTYSVRIHCFDDLDPSFRDSQGKKLKWNNSHKGHGYCAYAFKKYPENGRLTLKLPSKIITEQLRVTADNLELVPAKVTVKQDSCFTSQLYDWKKELGKFAAYEKSKVLEGTSYKLLSLRKSREVTPLSWGKKLEFQNFGVPMLSLHFQVLFAKKGIPPFKNVVFFKPIKMIDDKGKDLVGDRMRLNCSDSNGSDGKKYFISLSGIGAPSKDALAIKHLEFEIFCQDNKNEKRRAVFVMNDIPLSGMK